MVGAALIFAVALMMVIRLSSAMGTRLERSSTTVDLVTSTRERLDSLDALPYPELSTGSWADTLVIRGVTYERTWVVSQYGPLLRQIEVGVAPTSGTGPTYSAESFKADAW